MFMNTLPLRLQLEGLTVQDLIELTQRELIELMTYEQASLAVAQRCSGLSGSAPLFTTLLNYRHTTPAGDLRASHGEGGEARVLEIHEWTNYPISLSVDDFGDGFRVLAQTDNRIAADRVAAFVVTALENLVQSLERAPQTSALSLSILSERERRGVIEVFNSTDCDYPKDTLVHELFEERAEWWSVTGGP
jgi:non-ribosomal peptide synthetase component F